VAVLKRPGEAVPAPPVGAPAGDCPPVSSIDPADGKSKPLSRLTSVTCRRRSGRSVPRPRGDAVRGRRPRVRAPRRTSGTRRRPGVLLRAADRRAVSLEAPSIGLDLRTVFATTEPTTFALLFLDLDHAVLAAEHVWSCAVKAHEARQRRHLLELSRAVPRERTVRRAAGTVDRRDEASIAAEPVTKPPIPYVRLAQLLGECV